MKNALQGKLISLHFLYIFINRIIMRLTSDAARADESCQAFLPYNLPMAIEA